MSIAVLQFAVLAVTFAMTAGQNRAREADLAMSAVDLTEELMEEILALPYNDPDGASALGPESGESVPAGFDNTDDFHGYVEDVDPPSGVTWDFVRSVSMTLGSESIPDLGTSVTGLTVTVTVDNGPDQSWTITRFIAEEAP